MRKVLFSFSLMMTAANAAFIYWISLGGAPDSGSLTEAFPIFSLPRMAPGEGSLTQEDLRRHDLVALNVFASWCGPCRVEQPLLMELSGSVPVIGIDYMDTVEGAQAFLRELGNPFNEIALDTSGKMERIMDIDTVPRTYLIANGNIIYRHYGRLKREDLEEGVLPLIEARGGQVPAGYPSQR